MESMLERQLKGSIAMLTPAQKEKALAAVDERVEIAEHLASERENAGETSLAQWYLSKLGECDAMEERVKEQATRILAGINARRRALEWKWGREFRAQVERDLANQKGKKKSVDYLTGRAGFRAAGERLVIKDAEALEKWCGENYPEGLKLSLSASKIKEYIKESGEVPPGAEFVPKQERFYPSVENALLTEGDDDE